MYNLKNILNKFTMTARSRFAHSSVKQRNLAVKHANVSQEKLPNENIPFGMHLMFDAYDCDPSVLDDANVLYDLLDGLPKKLGMRPMIKPYIVRTPGNNKRDPGGWSGFVLIEESHISFHTFVKRRFVTVDIYTCSKFETDLATKQLKKFFKTDNAETIVEVRGKNYPSKNII